MTRLGFAFNPTNPSALELCRRAEAWAAEHRVPSWSSQAGDYERLVRELPTSDAVVVLGGDGTFLRAARAVATIDVPVLGINSGRMGFLSKAEPADLDRVLGQIAQRDYAIEERMALNATLFRGGTQRAETHVALNDAAVVRGAQARVVRLDVAIDDSHLATYVADGLVLATPTGSTAYSFSAGGPILDPTSRNVVVTPIAAYLASVRSIVVSPQHVVRVTITEAHDAMVSIDGREDYPLAVGDAVEVRPREAPIRFIEPRGALAFWDLLRQKAELLPS